MHRALRLALVGALVVVLVVAGGVAVLLFQFTQVQPGSVEHAYRYELTLQPDATLTNVTVYVPLPVADGSSPVGAAVVSDSPLAELPANWTTRVVQTDSGPMLAVEVDRLPPRYVTRPQPQPLPTGETPVTPTPGPTVTVLDAYHLTVELPANRTIDTRTPLGSEPTLQPREDARTVTCTGGVTGETTCAQFETRLFATFDAPANATTSLSVSYEGRNTWFAGGWTGNSFEQRFYAELAGPSQGWVVVPVDERVGFGNYPTPE